ncbi:hypothetical protein DERP_011146 [Dermatophagoides pteronyssinus]|uniref:Uncharacterized protein n=1 Tax=Dermatophagoides pteronyssinus TaxID=6956 RepID=A0ABQ8J9L1_DERPT|nr:hypothetical protein DERP_011146 [Dermatophagoides pteronyssinus]
MYKKPAIDFVQMSEMIKTRQDGCVDYVTNKIFYDCEIHFKHKSDYWPEEFWPTIPYHDWPKDGSDFAIVVGIPQQQQQTQYHPIPMDRVDFINSMDEQSLIINVTEYQYKFQFTSPETARFLRINDDDDDDDKILTFLPPPYPIIGGQSSSKSTTTYSTPEIPMIPIPQPAPVIEKIDYNNETTDQQQDDDLGFWDEEELNEIVYGDDF